MMSKFGKTAGESRNYKKLAIYGAVVLTLGVLLGYLFTSHGASSLAALMPMRCNVPEDHYRVVTVYQGDGQQEMQWYAYDVPDETSEAMVAASKKKGPIPAYLYHKFYKDVLCKATHTSDTDTGCHGLVVDAGAFLGTHALYMAKLGFTVHAFEPFKESYDLLACSVVANGFTKSMTIVREGLSDKNGKECVLPPLSTANHLATILRGRGDCSSMPELNLDVVTLDHYWENVLKSEPILFLKVDVEGHEAFVLDGASKVLREAPPRFILMEYYPHQLKAKSVTLDAFLGKIFDAGYRVYDCQTQEEVPKGADGESALGAYDKDSKATDLLMVRASEYPGDLPNFQCGY